MEEKAWPKDFVEICLGFVFLSTSTNYKWPGATPDCGKVQTLLLLNSWATDDKINSLKNQEPVPHSTNVTGKMQGKWSFIRKLKPRKIFSLSMTLVQVVLDLQVISDLKLEALNLSPVPKMFAFYSNKSLNLSFQHIFIHILAASISCTLPKWLKTWPLRQLKFLN